MRTASRSAAQSCAAAWAMLALIMGNGSMAQPTGSAEETNRWHFRVLLDGKPIGDHEFTVTRHAQDTEIRTSAHFKVKAAFITFFHYDHEDREQWAGGCLSQIDARTNDNGKQVEVRGSIAGGRFKLATGTGTFQDCVRTFAYWDRSALSTASQLLNSGTGEYTPVTLVKRGSEHISVNNRPTEAEHDSLQTNKFAIELWYSQAGQWLALQTQTEGGHTLRYEAQ